MSELELPCNISNYDENTRKLVIEYLNQLSDIEKKAYNIAKSHLGSSFNLIKSNGYCEWIKNKSK